MFTEYLLYVESSVVRKTQATLATMQLSVCREKTTGNKGKPINTSTKRILIHSWACKSELNHREVTVVVGCIVIYIEKMLFKDALHQDQCMLSIFNTN